MSAKTHITNYGKGLERVAAAGLRVWAEVKCCRDDATVRSGFVEPGEFFCCPLCGKEYQVVWDSTLAARYEKLSDLAEEGGHR